MLKGTTDIYAPRRKVELDRREVSVDIADEFKPSEQFQATTVWNGIISHLRKSVEVRKRRVRLRSYDQCFTGSDAVNTVLEYVNEKLKDSGTNHISREQATKLLNNSAKMQQQLRLLHSVNLCFSHYAFIRPPSTTWNVGVPPAKVRPKAPGEICQVMIHLNVIDSVHDGEKMFEDSAAKCFRFVAQPNGQLNLFSGVNAESSNDFGGMFSSEGCEDGKASNESLNDSFIRNPGVNFRSSTECYLFKQHHNNQQQYDIYEKHSSTEHIWREMSSPFVTPLNFIRRASLPNCAQLSSNGIRTSTPQKPTSVSYEDDVLHEAALCTLLTLVDVPVLDGIVNANQGPWIAQRSSFAQQSLVLSNFSLQRRFSSAPEFFCGLDGRSDDDDDGDDEWWHCALDCLELIPCGQDIYSRVIGVGDGHSKGAEVPTADQRKRELFRQMVDEYQCQSDALWPDSYSDLQMELYQLLMKDRLHLALKAFQLSLVILSKDVKQHIQQLLKFMRCAVDDNQVRLCSKTSNRLVIERSLAGAIVKNRRLNQHQTAFFVMFMVDHMEDVWKVPDDVMQTVRAKFSNSNDKILEKTFCRRISTAEFCRQKVEFTEKSLVELMNYILDNTQMSLKEKKRRFRQFAKQHRRLYLKHFADIV